MSTPSKFKKYPYRVIWVNKKRMRVANICSLSNKAVDYKKSRTGYMDQAGKITRFLSSLRYIRLL